jgi:glycosyltransferase involved in cell wall biosynthesis
VIVNSEAGRTELRRRRFPARRLHVVPNGIDVEVHRPDRSARTVMRAELGAAAGDLVIGRVGRLHAVKGNEHLLDALALLRERGLSFVAVFVGEGELHDTLRRRSAALGLAEQIRWVEPRADLSAVYSAFDVLVSCSISEGMPNVVAEAMAHEVPCVVTDVGDSAAVVGSTGAVVPPGDASALADAIEALARDVHDRERGRMARQRVRDCYSVDRMVTATETLLARPA